jgi:hypothetical protein
MYYGTEELEGVGRSWLYVTLKEGIGGFGNWYWVVVEWLGGGIG